MALPRPPTGQAPRRWLAVAGLLTFTLASIGLLGVPGVLVGALLAASWTRLPPEYTFTLGQFALVVLVPDPLPFSGGLEISQTLLGIGAVGLVAVLVAPPRDRTPLPTAVVTAITAGVVALGVLAGWTSALWVDSIWVALVGLGSGGALIGVGIREYEHWALETPTQEK